MSKLFILCCFCLTLLSCKMQSRSFEVVVENVQLLNTVPSGSGIVADGDSIFIIGDDATAIFKLSRSTNEFRSIPLLNNNASLARIPKPDKHDLECLTLAEFDGRESLFAFGSGSVSPQRDSLLIINADDPLRQQWVSLRSLYETLRELSSTHELNIEGSVITGNTLFLFNRSGNQLYLISMEVFAAYIQKEQANLLNSIKVHTVSLPLVNGIQSSLSGGCALPDGTILFSASLESAPNIYDDGDIGGSFIGIISMEDKPVVKSISQLRDKQGKVLADKLESIDVVGSYSNGDIKAIAVADNDDGKSKIFELRITIR